MELEALYAKVSDAIEEARYARRRGGEEAKRANLEVSALEQQIAELLPASDPEGVIARRSAVRTAILAGEVAQAKELVGRYSADPNANHDFKDELDRLLEGAGVGVILPEAPALFPIEVGDDERLHKAPAPIRAADDDDIDFEPHYAGLRRVLAEFIARVATYEASAARRYMAIAEAALGVAPARMADCSYLSLNRQLRLLLVAAGEDWVGGAEQSLIAEARRYYDLLPQIFEPLEQYRRALLNDGFVSPPIPVRQAMMEILESAATERDFVGDDLIREFRGAQTILNEAPDTDALEPERNRKWKIADAYLGAAIRIEAVERASETQAKRGAARFDVFRAKVSRPKMYLDWQSDFSGEGVALA